MPLSQGPSYDEIPQAQTLDQSSEGNPSGNAEAQIGELLSKIQTPELKALAEAEKQELLKETAQTGADSQALLQEFQGDIKALDYIEEKFSGFEGYDEMISFLQSTDISPSELESFFTFVQEKGVKTKREFKKNGCLCNRETFAIFADKFGIPTSIHDTESEIEITENLPKIQAISVSLSSIPIGTSKELDVFRQKLSEIENKGNISGEEINALYDNLINYLTGPDGKSGELDNIMVSLKKKDAENAAKGIKTTHFETFAQTARDFSPEVSKRITVFMEAADPMPPVDTKKIGKSSELIIAGGLPEGTEMKANRQGEYVGKQADGGEVIVKKDGDLITREINYAGADYPIKTGIETADVSGLIAEREGAKQEFAPKQQACERALNFLENPLNADMPLEDMKDGLLKLLGHELFNELGVRNASDKQGLISTIKTNAGVYKKKLEDAQKKFEQKSKLAAQKARERYVKRDEQMKLSLKSIKNSTLGKIGMDFLVSEMKGQVMTVNIGDTFDIGNINLATNDFGESVGETNSSTKHLENMYRIANKILTGSPDGMVDGTLVGFDLDPNKLKTGIAQKTQTEMMALLKDSGVWSETAGTNKEEVRRRLAMPVEQKV